VKDTELPGFWVLVGKRKKTFVVQGERKHNGQRLSVRMKLGDPRPPNQKAAKGKGGLRWSSGSTVTHGPACARRLSYEREKRGVLPFHARLKCVE
jgi:hypothetical protein